MTKRNGSELGDAVGVAIAVGVEQVASFAADEALVQTEALVEESLVRGDVPYVGVLLLRVPVLERRKRDRLAVEEGFATLVGRLARRGIVLGSRRVRCGDTAALAQVLRQ